MKQNRRGRREATNIKMFHFYVSHYTSPPPALLCLTLHYYVKLNTYKI